MDANRTRIHPASHTHPASHIEKTTTPQIRIISLDREPHLWQIATFQVGKRRKPLRVTWEDVQSRIQANMMELPLMAEPKLRPVREWQPRSQTYEVVGYQVVHELR